MNAAREILAELAARGASVQIDGQTLRLRPRKALDDHLLSRIKKHKPEIIEAITASCLEATPESVSRKALADEGLSAPLLRASVTSDEFPDADAYETRLQTALSGICRPDYPAGMIPWLGEHQPRLYAELTSSIPDDLNRLWREHAPLDAFDRLLARWSETHRKACAFFEADAAVRRRLAESNTEHE